MTLPFLQEFPEALHEGARLRQCNSEWLADELENAVWAGDVGRLQELAGCGCCCDEHTFEDCPARVWGGCRGQGTMTRADRELWAEHYERFHGMSREAFFR